MPGSPVANRARPLLRWTLRGTAAVLVLAAALYGGYVLVGPNFHTVIPGAIYRCAQPSAGQLERLVRRHGIHTVINLRGCCDPLGFYLDECRTTNRLNLSQEDIGLSANRLPSPQALRQLVDVLARSEYPVLLHCNKGADRSGLAAAAALLLLTDTPLEKARAQVGPRYGHLPLGRTVHIDRFFDLYEEWLAQRGLTHSRAAFRRWAVEEYCPGECRCEFAIPGPFTPPLRVPPGKVFPFRIRCRNTSIKPWYLRADSNAGIHAAFVVLDFQNRIVADGRGGLMEAVVAPGGHIDLTLAVPAPALCGSYALRVDMVDEQHAYFVQAGSEPLVCKLEVGP
jgi:hypothetical protein